MFVPSLTLRDSFLFATTFGFVVHAIYKRYETPPSDYLPTILLLAFPPVVSTFFFHQNVSSLLISIFLSIATFYGALLGSIVAYRLSPAHPLYRYPGPLAAKVSKLWMMRITSQGKMHEYVRSLHEKYGMYVRIGPNEISCIDVSVMHDILGPNGMPKGPVWDARRNPLTEPSLIAIRDTREHSRRRKPWNRALSTSAVKDYEPVIAKRVLQLANTLASATQADLNGKVVWNGDLSSWFGYYSFDFMGDMVFGGGFDLMRDKDKDGIRPLLRARTKNLASLIHVPWATRFLLNFPSITGNVRKFREFAYGYARRRKEMGSSVKDIFYHLTNEDGSQANMQNVSVDAVLSSGEEAIVAAADTVVNTLTGVFYYLLKHPRELARLREEVDRVFPTEDALDASRLAGMDFMNAVINETLRLQPVIQTYMERAPEKGSGGHWLGQRFITEGTAVITPLFTIHRDPSYFSPFPDDFYPDRWLSSNDSTTASSDEKHKWHTNSAAFLPFSMGPANCPGKNLALIEMRMVIAVLLQRFEIDFEDGYDVASYERDLEDRFITQVAQLRVSLRARK
ncbi:high nitrogen upregulated cytochrome P450 monooxygenase 2 [Schizopora paradoxa]|uniref:High nitrogen upregulated cytochrome P450 monooxygenase 2 n=1 Tax=Schizopora paradoxa TaxID=27342 RepID=A0A0H2RUY2_9AGAM|nr:high nitrogen upregulated cytochrome P450 monooxygenase 2 [Schizopora paradoxa]